MELYECHAHIIMDGRNYKEAVSLHADGVREDMIRRHFREYQKRGITYVRDGGDSYGVSECAGKIACEYGIEYRTPIFAIHKEGHYGGIVGYPFRDMKEFRELVKKAKDRGADFIKIMTTGIMDFHYSGKVTGTPLDAKEVREMVSIAHGEGMAVMSHTNGVYGVQAAVRAGADSIEHGNYIDEETIQMLAESRTVWVPTLVTIRNLLGCGRFADDTILDIWKKAEINIKRAFRYGVKVAPGSDGGAYRVYHGQGILDERDAFFEILGENEEVKKWLQNGETEIRSRFCRDKSPLM